MSCFALLQEGEQAEYGDSELRREVTALAERRLLRTLAVVQDVSDALLAIADIRGAHLALLQGFRPTLTTHLAWTSVSVIWSGALQRFFCEAIAHGLICPLRYGASPLPVPYLQNT